MLKEVVDGLRIYFEFHVDDHLLYTEEKEYVHNYLTDDNMRNCSLILNKSYEYINPSGDTELIGLDGTPVVEGRATPMDRSELLISAVRSTRSSCKNACSTLLPPAGKTLRRPMRGLRHIRLPTNCPWRCVDF